MKSEIRALADKFDALKKEERIETMILAAEKNMKVKDIAERLEIGESTARKYLKDLVAADVLLKTDDGHDYTSLGYKLRKDIEIQLEREEAEKVRDSDYRAEFFYRKNKAYTKQVIRDRIANLLD
jgi:predicted ArsR family transcriptional regulator